MTIRVFMGVLLSVVLLVTLGFVALDSFLLWKQITPLLTATDHTVLLTGLLVRSSITSVIFVLVLVATVFFTIAHFIARPIWSITLAMKGFAETQQRQELVRMWSPKEVRILAEVFDSFSATVEEVHKHDTEISRVKSDFISTAAHQLRTPLTGIRWALEALEREQLNANQQALVLSAKEKSKQLVSVVGTLLDISSIESGKYKYDMKREALDVVVGAVTQDFAPQAAQAQVSLLFEKTSAEAAFVMMDVERMRWVLNNLIENAIRYTPAGGSVRVTSEKLGDQVYIRVRDTGIGIPDQDRGNIFTRFYRASNAVSKENGGNGLGLYIARTIANDHGGELSFVGNDNGTGTTFSLSLPLVA